MGRTRSYRIRVRKRKIKKRQDTIKSLSCYALKYSCDCRHCQRLRDAINGERSGYLANDYYHYIGGTTKTKTKNTRVGRHTKGNYGKAIIYSRHDKVQIVYMNQELKEYYNNEGEFSDDYTN